jgi:putative hydrolase of the HAD superfamily
MTSSADSITTLLFDLDDTLYPPSSGVWQAIGERINRFMAERVGIPAERVAALREQYFVAFGTTLNGLRANHGVDPDEYLAFVHDIPLDRLLAEDLQLQAMLARLPQRKVIFSNADRAHAGRVLERLGVAHNFEQIIDIHSLGYINKPDLDAYRRALALLGTASAQECAIIDDQLRNLLPPKALGMRTVWVHPAGGEPGADYHIRSILNLPACLS